MKKIILFCLLFCNLFSKDNLPNYPVKLLNNQSSSLINLTGDVTLISFWATWCLPCIKEIDRINLEINKSNKIFSDAFMVYYHPQWKKVKELILNGEIGELKHVQGCFTYFNIDPKNMRNIPELGGGVLPDIGVYPLVTTRMVTEQEPIKVNKIPDN